jgi:prevent-host-death family protein
MTAEAHHSSELAGSIDLPATEVRGRLPELLEEVRDGGIVYLTRYGRRIAALVPVDVAENYERVEDDYWARRAADALAAGDEPVPWEQAVAELEGGEENVVPRPSG